MNMLYEFAPWETLNQLEHNTYIDLLGRVEDVSDVQHASALKKRHVVLTNGNMKQEVALLGDHADTLLEANDVVALAGVKVHEWRGERALQTVLLTAVEVNPAKRKVEHGDEGTPKKKALRMARNPAIRVIDAKEILDRMLRDAKERDVPGRDLTLVGKLTKISLSS